MTPEEAKLALEAARQAGHVGLLAWDKLCVFYQTEAIAMLLMVLVGHAALTTALVYVLRQPFVVMKTVTDHAITRTEIDGPNKWPFLAVALGIAWCCSLCYAVAPLPRVIATVIVPEMRAAVAVAAFTRGQPAP